MPALLYSWAQAERLGGHCKEALDLYRKYLYADVSPAQADATRNNIKLCEAVEPTPPPDTRPLPVWHWYQDRLGDALVISGAVGVGVGVVYLSLASGSVDRAHHEMYLDSFDADLDQASRRRTIAGLSLTVGSALAAAGVTLFVLHRHAVTATTDGRVVMIGGRL